MSESKLFFEKTCNAYPEQYDIFLNSPSNQVGYLRLRNGVLRLDYKECGGETIYSFKFNDRFKGCFSSDGERLFFITVTVTLLLVFMETKGLRIKEDVLKYSII